MSERPGRVRRAVEWTRSAPGRLWQARGDFAMSTASGVGVFLCYPDWNVFPLAFVTLVPLLAVAGRARPGRAFLLGTWSGFVTNLGGFYWVTNMLQDYGYMPWSISALLYALLCGQQGLTWGVALGLGRWVERQGSPALLAYPAAMAIAESVIPLIFPWYFGNSQFQNIAFIQAAELGGPVLLTALLVVSNVAVLQLVRAFRTRTRPGRGVMIALAVVVLAHALGAARAAAIRDEIASAETLNVGVVQANIGIYDKHERSMLADQLLLHQELSARLEDDGADLIVWPETAYAPPAYAYADDAEGQRRVVSARLDRHATRLPPSSAPLVESSEHDDMAGTPPADRYAPQRGFATPLLLGTVMYSRRTPEEMEAAPPRGGRPWPWDIHNSAILVDDAGWVLGAYDKTIRMVFSEYVPGGRLLWRLTGINLYRIIPSAGDFFGGQPTEGFVLPTEGGDVRIGAMICYEDIMPSFGRAIHSGRPHFIVNMTNDAWFGDTAEPRLHLALSVLRAVEQRTMLIRSTNTGVSAFIDATGRIVARTGTFEEATLMHPTPLMEARTTAFMALGNWTPWLLGVACLAAIARRWRRDRRVSAGAQPGDVA